MLTRGQPLVDSCISLIDRSLELLDLLIAQLVIDPCISYFFLLLLFLIFFNFSPYFLQLLEQQPVHLCRRERERAKEVVGKRGTGWARQSSAPAMLGYNAAVNWRQHGVVGWMAATECISNGIGARWWLCGNGEDR
jgi:hypothetical protein